MNLELNKEQYEKLCRMVFIARVVFNASGLEVMSQYNEVEQIIFSKCGEAGMEGHFKKFNRNYVLNEEYMVSISQEIVKYNNACFQNILPVILAENDMIEKYRNNGKKKPEQEEYLKERWEIVQEYQKSIEKYGLSFLSYQKL